MAKTNTASDYTQVINPKGYINNREITNLSDFYLVKGSQNMIIKNAEKAMTRKGTILKGAGKTMSAGIKSAFDWSTSSNTVLNTRSYFNAATATMEAWWNGSWRTVITGLSAAKLRYTTWWNTNELIDVLLFVLNDSKIREWSGGFAQVASVSSNTITKQGYISGTDVSFNNNGSNTPGTILKASGGLTAAGFAIGNIIAVQGSVSNDGTYTILSVTDNSIAVSLTTPITTEVAGASVVVKWKTAGTWAESRFFTINAGDGNNRSVNIRGITYTYTGGEATGTLTGVTPSPPVQSAVPVTGDLVVQTVRIYTPTLSVGGGASSPAFLGFNCNLISMQNNYVFYGSTTSREIIVSKSANFADMGYTTPIRKPGEGFELVLDSCPTAFAPAADQATIQKNGLVTIFGGTEDEYLVTFTQSSDLTTENISISKQKTGTGLAARSQECVATIRNAILFLTQEPTLDMIGHMALGIDVPKTVPLSDPIKDDIEAYDLTDASMKYVQRNLYIALPKQATYLIRDFQNNYWQPPQVASYSFFSVIDGELCAHSAYSNETYQLNQGYNDNGSPISFVAAYGYDNYAARFSLKGFDEHATELYMSQNTKVLKTINYEYKGSQDQRSFIIDGSIEAINFLPKDTVSLGSHKLGDNPIGSSANPLSDTTDGYESMGKCRCIQSTSLLDFFERQVVFSSSKIDDRWMIIGFGENVMMSDNNPSFIKDQ